MTTGKAKDHRQEVDDVGPHDVGSRQRSSADPARSAATSPVVESTTGGRRAQRVDSRSERDREGHQIGDVDRRPVRHATATSPPSAGPMIDAVV